MTPRPTPSETKSPTETNTPSITPTPTAHPTSTPFIHVVQEGEHLGMLAARYDMDMEIIAEANQIDVDSILRVGQELVIPMPTSVTTSVTDERSEASTVIPSSTPTPGPTSTPFIHVVQEGEHLGVLAVRYDVDMETIAEANQIDVDSILRVGQELVIPGPTATPTSGPPLPFTATYTPQPTETPSSTSTLSLASSPSAGSTDEPIVHIVQAGDILGELAVQYNVAVEAIADANGIEADAPLRIGQELRIPPSGGEESQPTRTATAGPTAPPAVHIVAAGETLSEIAVKYDVSMDDIARASGIKVDSVLRVGAVLTIPDITLTPEPTPTATPTITLVSTRVPTIAPRPRPTSHFAYGQIYLLAPTNGSVFTGPEARILLNWTSAGILEEDEAYMLHVWRPGELAEPITIWTQATSWRVPKGFYAEEEPPHSFSWQVTVVRRDSAAQPGADISPKSQIYTFRWE